MVVEIFYRANMHDKETGNVIPIFGIGHHDLKGSNDIDSNKSKFSYQFYKDGEHFDYFLTRIRDFYEKRCRGDIDFDYLTIVPTHHINKFNENMIKLCNALSKELKIQNSLDIIKRIKEAKPLHKIQEKEERMKINKETLKISIDVNGKNILVLDNTSTSGSTAQILFHMFKENGANNIIFIVLGLGTKYGTAGDFDINCTQSDKISMIIKRFHGTKISKVDRDSYNSEKQDRH